MGIICSLGFLDCLTLLFIGLRLTGNINWSWWYVTMPTWIQFAAVILLFVGLIIYFLIARIIGFFKRIF